MRIVSISTDFGIPIHGHKGASIHVRELASALQTQGHELHIVTSRSGGEAPAGFSVPVHEIQLNRSERQLIALLQDDPHAGEPVSKEVRSMLYATSFQHQARSLLRDLQPDAIYERYALLGTAGIELARELDVPHILEVNAPLSEEHAQHRGSAFAQTIRAIEQHILEATNQVIAVSEPLKQWIVDRGIDAGKVTVAPNGVNLERFATPGNVRIRPGFDDRPVVGFVGTLKPWHGTANLIRAIGLMSRQRGMARTPGLLIVGDGPQRQDLERVSQDEGIASLVTITGAVPHNDMPSYLAGMDVAVAPYDSTPDFYFSPLKLFEYMAAGLPVIAAGIGQIPEIIRHGETGLIYPPGDTEALSRCIGDLLDNRDRARNLGRAAQETARTHHSWTRNGRIVTTLIERERTPRAAGTHR